MAKLKGSKHSSQAINNASFDEAYGIKKQGLYGWDGAQYVALKVDSQGRLDIGLGIGTTIASGTAGSVLFVDNSGNLAQDNSHLYYDASNVQFLVGTNSPLKTSTMYIGASPTANTDVYGSFGGFAWSPTADNSALAAAFGFVAQSEGSHVLTGQLKGIDGFAFHNGTSSIASVLGAGYLVQNNNTGSINAAYGVSAAIQSNNASGSINLTTAFNAGSPTATGTISNAIGHWVHNQGGANVTLAAAMYIEDTTGASTNYGILSLGGNHTFNAAQTNGPFTIMGSTDTGMFVANPATNSIGIGTSDFSTPGATSTNWGIVRKKDGAIGGSYFRSVQTADSQLTMGTYNLLSGRSGGSIAATGTQIIGTQNELYPATAGTSSTHNVQAYGNYNYLESVSNATYSQMYGQNSILVVAANNSQNLGEVVILNDSADNTTDASFFTQITNTGSAVTRTVGAFGAIMNWQSVNETISGVNITTTGISTINNPAQLQAGIYLNWNVPGTDSGLKKWGIYVNGTANNSSKSYFGDDILLAGAINHTGSTLGFYGQTPTAQSSAYTPTNVSTDRSYDANATTLDEVADVLGTLISDLQATGLIG